MFIDYFNSDLACRVMSFADLLLFICQYLSDLLLVSAMSEMRAPLFCIHILF